MRLSQLILAVGDENITVQNLADSSTVVNVRKQHAEVTFVTSADSATGIFANGGEAKYVALVVWLPLGKVAAARKGGDQ